MIQIRRSFFTLSILLTPLLLPAQELIDRSPFLPPGHGIQSTAPNSRTTSNTPQSYEFRGFFSINDEVRVLVKAADEQNGRWVRVDDASVSPHVLSFNPDDRSLILMHNGSELKLDLIELGANSSPIPVAGQARPQRAPSIQSPTQNNTNRTSIRRRTVPPRRPQWMEERMRQQQGNTTSGNSNNPQQQTPRQPPAQAPTMPEGGFPTDIPPPPTGVPPPPPEGAFQNLGAPPIP